MSNSKFLKTLKRETPDILFKIATEKAAFAIMATISKTTSSKQNAWQEDIPASKDLCNELENGFCYDQAAVLI